MFKRLVLAGALAFAFSPAAHAAVISFDDATGGGPNSEYTSGGFTFKAASAVGDTKCFRNKCIKETQQGDLSTMTYNDGADEIDDAFNLDFFYFTVQGITTEINNNFTVTGIGMDGNEVISASFQLGDPIPSTTTTGATISFAKDIGSASGEDEFENNVGYWVDLDDQWNDLYKVVWTINTTGVGSRDGQARLDCVGAFESITGVESDCVNAPPPPPPPPQIPLPAAGWLLLGGLGGLATLRRKKKVS